MSTISTPNQIPSIHRLLNDPSITSLISDYGNPLVTRCARAVQASACQQVLVGQTLDLKDLIDRLQKEITHAVRPSLKRVINLTGTVLHTNLGRAVLPQTAIDAINDVARGASNLEFDLGTGKRGDRHQHTEALLRQLTGAEAALVVNNNAAAVMLTLNSLALRKQVPVSRGELIEIGGSFRIPDIMARSGCKLVEVGTTNRTHAKDFEASINAKTALLMKVHCSNYAIQGFTHQVTEAELVKIAHDHDLPFVTDLGSGTLVDLEDYGLPQEPTVRDAIKAGVDLVTFSGDKLLGGPQAGIIAGRSDLISKLKKNPMTRAMRPDKITIAALHAVLLLYNNPKRLNETLPTLHYLTRDATQIEKIANNLAPKIQGMCGDFEVSVNNCHSQIGSGALPLDTLASVAIKISKPDVRRPGNALEKLAKKFRELPIPVIGRIADDALLFDLRCLGDETEFVENLRGLVIS